jgi:hypothetical protein
VCTSVLSVFERVQVGSSGFRVRTSVVECVKTFLTVYKCFLVCTTVFECVQVLRSRRRAVRCGTLRFVAFRARFECVRVCTST